SNQLKDWKIKRTFENPIYENNFSFNIGIIGFGTSIGAGSSMTGVDSAGNSLGYGRPFFLNN
ncbi:hypothetical protein L6W93_003662, partial [Vibrio cholerae]|nr:hypothetical protein [Vibrio cholerae]